MRTIYAEYNINHDSIDVYTSAGYMLRIDCWEAEKNLKTTYGSECALTSLAVDEPLEYARLYLDGNLQEKKDSSLFHTLAQAMSSIVYAAEKKEIAVSVDCPENLIISHDSKWTSEALFNLLDNAVKYTPSGGKISVSVVQWEMYVEVKVTDTGKGISESNQAAIFGASIVREEVHDQQGVGIGLYLAREIVTRQGGYIKVVSELGQGSEFSIMLPVR